jgi:small subunit ribosomal protein S9
VSDETTPPEAEDAGATTGETAPPTEPADVTPPEGEAVDPDVAESVAAPQSEAPATPAAQSDAPDTADEAPEEEDGSTPPRERPAIPGADLEVDIVIDGEDRTRRPQYGDEEDLEAAADEQLAAADEETVEEPIAQVTIDLGAEARYRATGKRKTAIARVILRPGTGVYTINGKTMDDYFPRATLQKTIRQQLDVIARMNGGGVSAQADALRHGISRALLEADPNLRGELKRRGFLTRDARAKERKKAGLKKARKRPQFSKR